MGIIPFLTSFQEGIILKPFKKKYFVSFRFMRKLFRKVGIGEKKSNYYTLLGKFLVSVIDSKGGQHDLKG